MLSNQMENSVLTLAHQKGGNIHGLRGCKKIHSGSEHKW